MKKFLVKTIFCVVVLGGVINVQAMDQEEIIIKTIQIYAPMPEGVKAIVHDMQKTVPLLLNDDTQDVFEPVEKSFATLLYFLHPSLQQLEQENPYMNNVLTMIAKNLQKIDMTAAAKKITLHEDHLNGSIPFYHYQGKSYSNINFVFADMVLPPAIATAVQTVMPIFAKYKPKKAEKVSVQLGAILRQPQNNDQILQTLAVAHALCRKLAETPWHERVPAGKKFVIDSLVLTDGTEERVFKIGN